MARIQFNAAGVPPDTRFDPVPAGWYNVMIDESAEKPTKDGLGSYLEFRYDILDGKCKGRKVFGRHNTRNPSAQAMDIAFKQLSALCHATGVMTLEDTQQLHGIPLKIKVSLRPERTEEGKHYEASNDIRGWKNINEPTDDVPVTAQAQQRPTAPAAAPSGWGQPAQQPMQQAPQFQQPQQPVAQPQQAQPWQQQQPAQQGAPAWAPQQQPAQQPQQPAYQQPAQQPQAAPWQQPQQGAPAGQPAPWQQPAQQPQVAQQQPQQPAAQPAAGMAPPWAAVAAGQQSTPPWQQPR